LTNPLLDPRFAKAAGDLESAVQFERQGLVADAEKKYASIIKKNPQYFDALHFYAIFKFRRGQFGDAFKLVDRARKVNPRSVAVHNTTGVVLDHLKRHAEAVASFDATLAFDPRHVPALANRANSLNSLGRFDEALASCDRALTIDPAYLDAHIPRGAALLERQRYDEALASYDAVLKRAPHHAVAWVGYGNVLAKLERHDDALAAYDRALAINPNAADAWLGRGNVHFDLERYEKALHAYDRTIALKPQSAETWLSLGACHFEQLQVARALQCFDRAIALRSDYPEAIFSKAIALLLLGRYEEGWKLYERRWQSRHLRRYQRSFPYPLWSGREALKGKTILLHSEQGLGDSIQFCRYVRLVADLGATIVLEAPRSLVELYASLSGVDHLIVAGDPLPATDFQCPLMSLPLVFHTTLSTIPAPEGYLRAGRAKAEFWRDKLGPRTRPRVGLIWSSGVRPDQPEVARNQRRKSIPLAKFAPLRELDVEFYNLQKGEAAEAEFAEMNRNQWHGPLIFDYPDLQRDFSDAAALMENLDLVISVDTSTAHLAGALGVPVWVLNRFDTDWRWLLERTDSPWYASARIYRQQRAGDWDEVIERVMADLRTLERRA